MQRKTRVLWISLISMLGCAEQSVDVSGEYAALGEACLRSNAPSTGEELPPLCAEGLVCELVGASGDASSAATVCADPVELRGLVFDALTDLPIAGARVAALDATGTPVADVTITDPTGSYILRVPAYRANDGTLAEGLHWTLFVSAADYQPFPAGLRPALPIHAEDAIADASVHVVENASTQVALLPMPLDAAGGRTISGRIGIAGDDVAGTLVVAEPGPSAVYTLCDASGQYTLFNVPPGEVTITAYRQGVFAQPVVAPSGLLDPIDLPLLGGPEALVTVQGSVNIVNAPGGSATSVVLVPASVFNEALERGPVPWGLRAPGAPLAPSITGAFAIEAVPPGRYKILAGFENDELVRDPDTGIGGTGIPEIEVGGSDVAVSESFKITQALAVVSPGAQAPEVVDGPPVFRWVDDSSEDFYTVVVHDAFGSLIWEDNAVPRVTGMTHVEVMYAGPALTDGMYYQFRATSMRDRNDGATPISRTEDLRGVFVAP